MEEYNRRENETRVGEEKERKVGPEHDSASAEEEVVAQPGLVLAEGRDHWRAEVLRVLGISLVRTLVNNESRPGWGYKAIPR